MYTQGILQTYIPIPCRSTPVVHCQHMHDLYAGTELIMHLHLEWILHVINNNEKYVYLMLTWQLRECFMSLSTSTWHFYPDTAHSCKSTFASWCMLHEFLSFPGMRLDFFFTN